MERSVLATCPGCGEQLRIPAQWVDRAVKCKKCGAVVKAKAPSAPVAPPAPATGWSGLPAAAPPVAPVAYPVAPPPLAFDPSTGTWGAAAAPPGYPYPPPGYPPPQAPVVARPVVVATAPAPRPTNAFADMGEGSSPSARRRRASSNLVPLLLVFGIGLLVLAGGAAGLFVFKDQISTALGFAPPSTDPTPTAGEERKATTPAAKGGAPRRMLAVSVTKYLYCNPLVGGRNKNGASELNEAVKGVAFRYQVPDSQFYLVTDADGKLMQAASPRPMLKEIILDAITKFCDSSRGQDRVVIYFGGHATTGKDGKVFLIPAEGDPAEPDTLIPLEVVWAKLAACKAQQKVILFDVCRLSTDDNAVRPGSEPMTPELEKALHSPPAGVQVLTSCSQGQTAAEFRTAEDADTPQGSAFLGALRAAARKAPSPPPTDPFPVNEWAKLTGDRLQNVLGKERPSTPKVSGGPGAAEDADPSEPAAERFEVALPPKGANPQAVKAVFVTLRTPPLLGGATDRDDTEAAVFFPEDALKEYRPGVSAEEVAKLAAGFKMKEGGKDRPARASEITPAQWKELKENAPRVAAVMALDEVRTKWRQVADPERGSVLYDGLTGKASDDLKKQIEREQKPMADAILELGELVEALTDEKLGLQAAGEADESKFWQATFRFALAQAKMRLAFVNEANLALGNVRTDSLPESATGLRLVQRAKMANRKEEAGGKQALKMFAELAKDHKATPFEVLAKQWRVASLGLEWKPKRDDADTTGGVMMADDKK